MVEMIVALFLSSVTAEFILLDPSKYEHHFVEGKPSPSAGKVNVSTYEWSKENLPFFDCDDPDLVSAYYYRWHAAPSFFLHMK